MKTLTRLLPVLLIAALATACGSEAATATPVGAGATPTGAVGLANPAAVYCTQLGYRHEIRTAADGSQSGVCIFPDGSECDAWAFFRGECGMSFQATATPKPTGNGAPATATQAAAGKGSASAAVATTGAPSAADASGVDRAEGWLGTIVKLPAGSQFGHYFLRDDGQRYGIHSTDSAMSDLILAHRGDGIRIQVWGPIEYGIPDTEARQIQPERIEAVSSPATPVPGVAQAEGWIGTIVKLPAGSQFGHYFLREDGQKYGIHSTDSAMSDLILAHRGNGIRIQVWGPIEYGIPDTEARQIQPERIETVNSPATPVPGVAEAEGWIGTIVKLPAGSQFGHYFLREDGQKYGIGAIDPSISKLILAHRGDGVRIRVWGYIQYGVPATEARQIEADHIEVI